MCYQYLDGWDCRAAESLEVLLGPDVSLPNTWNPQLLSSAQTTSIPDQCFGILSTAGLALIETASHR